MEIWEKAANQQYLSCGVFITWQGVYSYDTYMKKIIIKISAIQIQKNKL